MLRGKKRRKEIYVENLRIEPLTLHLCFLSFGIILNLEKPSLRVRQANLNPTEAVSELDPKPDVGLNFFADKNFGVG